jgi:Mlc titration factor MtfA (ptsG expression regulator)
VVNFRFWRKKEPRFDPLTVEAVVEANVALAKHFDDASTVRLLELTNELIDDKRWEAVPGLDLTQEMVITLAANAAIPILELDTYLYRNVESVILHPSAKKMRGLRRGPTAGTYSDNPVHVVGQAAAYSGPVTLSWDVALANSRSPRRGHNVTIHEFAHKIDMVDGYADGAPPQRDTPALHWQNVLEDEYYRTKSRKSDKTLRPYAWTNQAEFFAVATEAFFCKPRKLAKGKPELYAALATFYRQDPQADRPARRHYRDRRR